MESCLEALPFELSSTIGRFLPTYADLAATSRTSKSLHAVFNPLLYRRASDSKKNFALFWAADTGQSRTVELLLDAGTDPNLTWWTNRIGQRPLDRAVPPGFVVRWHTGDGARKHSWHWTALHLASLRGHEAIAVLLLDRGADIDRLARGLFSDLSPYRRATVPGTGQLVGLKTPLYMTIRGNHESMARLLIERGASKYVACPYPQDDDSSKPGGYTALHAACRYGQLPLAKFLVDEESHHADINSGSLSGGTPLTNAYVGARWECFDWLLEKGATMASVPDTAPPMLADAIHCHRFADANRLIDRGHAIEVTDDMRPFCIYATHPTEVKQQTGHHLPLPVKAARSAIPEAVRYLLENGADVNAFQVNCDTALMSACTMVPPPFRARPPTVRGPPRPPFIPLSRVEIVTMLLEAGADVNLKGHAGRTALIVISSAPPSGPKLDIVRLLLDHGADPHESHQWYLSAFGSAFVANDLESCRLMCAKHPLHQPSYPALIRLLLGLRYRAPLEKLEFLLEIDEYDSLLRSDEALLQTFKFRNNAEACIIKLLERGANYEAAWEDNKIALTQAMKKSYVEVAKELLKLGANPNVRNKYGTTPLAQAVVWPDENQRLGLVEALLKAGADIHMPNGSCSCSEKSDIAVEETPLEAAISAQRDRRDPEVLEMLLRYQPLDSCPDELLRRALYAACDSANFPAFKAIVDSGGDEIVKQKVDLFVLGISWDILHEQVETVADMDEAVSILGHVLELATPSPDIAHKCLRKLIAHSTRTFRKQFPRAPPAKVGISWCLRRRIRFLDNSTSSVIIAIKPYQPHPFAPATQTLGELGERLLLEAKRSREPEMNYYCTFFSWYGKWSQPAPDDYFTSSSSSSDELAD
ncbi:uncharacterized protein JN550_008570 [Neoarthrinium moseri]|uniref:uncharacterized protein n=1 Tax=Neoarthrinium moseri TaxID=1658444 RepID=UPI001FDEA174|nr:uncharacterized protein JN550_008570 [Neoarthrinium moseri]KAI1865024.1 hypothetical protein JN550_008570 [Neoarthrinium moseri]